MEKEIKKIELEDKGLQTKKFLFKGEVKELKSYMVSIHDLLYNPINTRVYDVVYEKYGDIKNDKDNFYSKEIQETIFETLKKDHNDKTNMKLLNSISKGGIIDLFVITENGVVLSGNNRLSIIRANLNRKNSPFDNWEKIQVYLVEGHLFPESILEWELSLQNEIDIKKSYDEMNVVMRTAELVGDNNRTSNDILKITKYKDKGEIDKAVEIANLYYELLLWAGIPENKSFHKQVKIYSYLDGLNAQLKKSTISKSEIHILKRIYFKSILSTTIPVQKIRDLLNVFVGKQSLEASKRISILENIETMFDEKISDILEENKEVKFKEGLVKRLDFTNDEKGIKMFFAELTNYVRENTIIYGEVKKNSFDSINKKIKSTSKTIKDLSNIEEEIFNSFDLGEKTKLINSIEENKKTLENILQKLK